MCAGSGTRITHHSIIHPRLHHLFYQTKPHRQHHGDVVGRWHENEDDPRTRQPSVAQLVRQDVPPREPRIKLTARQPTRATRFGTSPTTFAFDFEADDPFLRQVIVFCSCRKNYPPNNSDFTLNVARHASQ